MAFKRPTKALPTRKHHPRIMYHTLHTTYSKPIEVYYYYCDAHIAHSKRVLQYNKGPILAHTKCPITTLK